MDLKLKPTVVSINSLNPDPRDELAIISESTRHTNRSKLLAKFEVKNFLKAVSFIDLDIAVKIENWQRPVQVLKVNTRFYSVLKATLVTCL